MPPPILAQTFFIDPSGISLSAQTFVQAMTSSFFNLEIVAQFRWPKLCD
jgi:hypothetical protein